MHRKTIMVAILLIGLLSCAEIPEAKEVTAVPARTSIDSLQLKGLDDQPLNTQPFKGKTVVVNFWATWCKPCIEEMPSLEAAQQSLEKNDVLFLLASSESAAEIEQFKSNHTYRFNYVRVENPEELNIQGLPTTFIFNPKDSLVFREMGVRKWNDSANIQLILKIAQ